MTVVAFDSRNLRRRGAFGNFNACIGAGVRIEDASRFWNLYAKSIRKHLDALNLPNTRFVYKSYHLLDIGGPIAGRDIMERILKDLMPEISEVLICYCILPKNTLPSMTKLSENGSTVHIPVVNEYWEDGPAVQIPVVKFMNQLSNYYPVICAYEYATLNPNQRNTTDFLLDNVQGPDNEAWRSLSGWNVKIYPSGDEVSPPIAFADIVIRLLDLRLGRSRLDLRGIEDAFSEFDEKLKVRWTGPAYLANMAPATRRDMNLSNRFARPRVLVIGKTDRLMLKSLKDVLEGVGAWDSLCNLAASVKGSLKVFEQTRMRDLRNVASGDISACYGNEAFETAELVSQYHDAIRIIDVTKPDSWSPKLDEKWYGF